MFNRRRNYLFAIIFAFFTISFIIFQFFTNFQIYVVLSDSSAPTYVTGDIVVIDTEFPLDDYQIGDAILYQSALIRNIIIIHRIYDIQEINGSRFFAIKGDANPQPDVVAPISPVFNLNQTGTVTWDYFYPGSENPETEILASYFPAEDVVLGRVTTKFPFLGWILVPFNSPVGEPFGILPISLFTMFFAYFIIVGIGALFYLIYQANETLKKFLLILAINQWMPNQQFRIKVPGIYQLLIIPLIIFEFAFATALPAPVVVTQDITLTKAEFITDIIPQWHLQYEDLIQVNNPQFTITNRSTISITLWNQSGILYVNYSKSLEAKGTGLIPSLRFDVTEQTAYTQQLNPNNLFIIDSNDTHDPFKNKFFEYAIPLQEQEPEGLMTRNIFLAAENSEFNGISVYKTFVSYSFIQELISVSWEVTAYFNKQNGFLLKLELKQIESLWAIPEMVSMIIPVVLILLYYEFVRNQIQKKFDERQNNILKAQEQEQGNRIEDDTMRLNIQQQAPEEEIWTQTWPQPPDNEPDETKLGDDEEENKKDQDFS